MDIQTFDKLVERETKRMKDVMCSKSADYADGADKLFNFKLAAKIDGITPIEALRGMRLKHQASIRQGLDELITGKCRSEKWWTEKLTDDRNYSILLQALLVEKYFKFVVPEGWVIERDEDGRFYSSAGWSVCERKDGYMWLQKDNQFHRGTDWKQHHKYGEAPGYWPTKEAAEAALQQYLEKENVAG